ncbi:Na(+)/H(+) exchange regulatory cofactor NHE-RF2 [Silurus asotus]|uniref:Na(+)/H(+) exchange regulatory cofactor NHE-RF2 n=1 Tax=Silurus asotus TaxID=30991 RepID=A0AAD5AQL8_SILAS|nr:Na(+)/H(+) exchange regulatory cofactor NHE-RF2 [Silurus asotus]
MKADVQKEMDEKNLRPRLCYLTKGERGYGFHLHGERSSGAQFIRRIEAESPAELAGLRSGDRVVEVNGENVEKLSHQEAILYPVSSSPSFLHRCLSSSFLSQNSLGLHQVVQKIMEVENRTRLLVVDRGTEEFLLLHSLPCVEDLAVEMSCLLSPRTSSSSLASSTLSFSTSSRGSVTPSPPASIILSPRDFTTQSFSDSITSSPLPKSITSSPPDSITPLPCDSIVPIVPSPCKSAALSPDDFIERSSRNSVNLSLCDSTTCSSSNFINQSPRASEIQPPSSLINQSPCDSATCSSSNSINQLPCASEIQTPSNPINQSPRDSAVPSPSNNITQFLYDSIAQPTYNSITSPPSNSVIQSPYDSITQSSTSFITTPFTMEKSQETHVVKIIITPDKKETSGTEDVVARDLRPRLCHIVKEQQGFGFNLHCEKRRVGHYIRSVDPDSPAQRAGLQPGDRLIEVNGKSVGGLRHTEVVEIIRSGGGQTKLLVVDPETDALFQKLDITPTTVHLNEDCVDGPLIQSPTSTCPITKSSASPSNISNGSQIREPITSLAPPVPPIRNGSLKQQTQESSSSRSFASEISSEMSSPDTNNKVLDSDCNSAPCGSEVKVVKGVNGSDPLCASGLHLSPTAAEARQKVRSKKANKRAPPMAWNKKYEIFSNF